MKKETDDRKPPAAAAPAAADDAGAEGATKSQSQTQEDVTAMPATMWKNLEDLMTFAKTRDTVDATKMDDAKGAPCTVLDEPITIPLLKRVCQAIQSQLFEKIYDEDALK
eukprot:4950831-Lingulodinium_polyedra.AAC.1